MKNIEHDRVSAQRVRFGPKSTRPAEHRCSVCRAKVTNPLDSDAHVCVPDETGTTEFQGLRWRATTAREAREARERKNGKERRRDHS